MKKTSPALSIVIPLHNEEGNLSHLHQRLIPTVASVTQAYEIIYVNDGSKDATLSMVKALAVQDDRVHYISFSRNFGHQMAIMSGIEHATGDAVVIMDGDLQDPPELIPELWQKYREGFKVVYAQRRSREGETLAKKWTAKIFYRLLKKTTNIKIPLDTGDFRLIDRKVVEYLKQMPERHKFLRGQIAWIGFKQTAVFYDREIRLAGKTNFSFSKMFQFALDGITAFSNYPLRMATVMGFAVSAVSFLVILYALYSKFVLNRTITGWTSLIISVLFIGGVQLIAIGIIGEYISRINSDVRKRPLYVIEEENITKKKSTSEEVD